ncbi:hypothetical protein BDZ89DRAFT_274139 [Hymenopellis radicata]|nr:hypothetical protein BDZ89DRAFT_274139 [Hymenopellis radicata]
MGSNATLHLSISLAILARISGCISVSTRACHANRPHLFKPLRAKAGFDSQPESWSAASCSHFLCNVRLSISQSIERSALCLTETDMRNTSSCFSASVLAFLILPKYPLRIRAWISSMVKECGRVAQMLCGHLSSCQANFCGWFLCSS